jgi:glycosyltransferase involved in cell wall biosynthesis
VDTRLVLAVLDSNNRIAADNNGRRPRVFIDLSTTLNLHGQQATGALRTEREIARQLLEEPRIIAIPFVFSAGSIRALDRVDALRLVERSPGPEGPTRLRGVRRDPFIPMAAPAAEGLAATLHDTGHETFVPNTPATAIHAAIPARRRMLVRAALRKLARRTIDVMPAASREDVRLVLIHGREIVRKTFRKQPPQARVPVTIPGSTKASILIPTVECPDEIARALNATFGRCVEIGWPEMGEILLTCGFYGAVVPLRLIAEARERVGFSCVAICHEFPHDKKLQWNPEKPQGLHYACISMDLLDVADRILCFSSHTRSRLIDFACHCGRATPDARVIVAHRTPAGLTAEAALPRELDCRRFALSVGPVSRRQNLGVLVRAWEALSDRPDFRLDLVLVGHAAEGDKAAIGEVEASPLFGRRILWFDECPDDVLDLLYRRADALLYPGSADPGISERCDLPLAEALFAGVPVLASNTIEVPGAGFVDATLLDPGEEGAWRKALLDLVIPTLRPSQPTQPPLWDTAASEIVSHILEIARARSE